MAKLGALMGIGAGLTAAGQVIDRHFIQKMEEMRQNSLMELENRKLNLAERELKENREFRNQTVELERGRDFQTAVDKYWERQNKRFSDITDQLPSERAKSMMTAVLKQAMADPMMMAELYTTDPESKQLTLDPEKLDQLSTVINGLAGSLSEASPEERQAIRSAAMKLAKGAVKDWEMTVRQRFPQLAGPQSIGDVLSNYPLLGMSGVTEKPEVEELPERPFDPLDSALMGDPREVGKEDGWRKWLNSNAGSRPNASKGGQLDPLMDLNTHSNAGGGDLLRSGIDWLGEKARSFTRQFDAPTPGRPVPVGPPPAGSSQLGNLPGPLEDPLDAANLRRQ